MTITHILCKNQKRLPDFPRPCFPWLNLLLSPEKLSLENWGNQNMAANFRLLNIHANIISFNGGSITREMKGAQSRWFSFLS